VICLYCSAVFGLLVSKRVFHDFFTPPAIYNFFWCFALATLELGWVSFDPLGATVWKAIGLSYLGFMTGCLIIFFYGLTRKNWRTAQPNLGNCSKPRMETALAFLFILGIIGFGVQLIHLQMEVGLSSFITDPQRVRDMHSNVKFFGFFDILNLGNFVLALMYLLMYRQPKKWVLLMMLWALMTTFVSTDRTRFFYTIIWAFYAFVYLKWRVDLSRRIIVTGLVVLGILMGFFMLIAKIYVKQAYDDNMEYINLPPDYALMVDPYIYLTGSFPVLQAVLADEQERTLGKYTFEPAVKLIEVVYPDLSRAEIVSKFYRVPVELNVGTYVQPFYLDWGWPGLIAVPFLIGLLTSALYLQMRQSKSLLNVYAMSLMSFCITISIFVNHFTQVSTWFFLLVGFLVHRFTLGTSSDPGSLRSGIYPDTSTL